MARIGGNHVQGCERPRKKAPSVPPKSAVWGSTGEMVGKARLGGDAGPGRVWGQPPLGRSLCLLEPQFPNLKWQH